MARFLARRPSAVDVELPPVRRPSAVVWDEEEVLAKEESLATFSLPFLSWCWTRWR